MGRADNPVWLTTSVMPVGNASAGRMRRLGALLAALATLDAGLAQQLAVLFLRHPLAALLDHRAHIVCPLNTLVGPPTISWRPKSESDRQKPIP
jgi:hypothetical protein